MEINSTSEEQRAYNVALRHLTVRPHTIAETRQKLQRRFMNTVVEVIISRLVEHGFLDDSSYAKQWKESRQRTRPRSARLLRWEMRKRGVPEDAAAISTSDIDDEATALEVAQRYAKRLAGVDQQTFWRRLGQHLSRRGFSLETIGHTSRHLTRPTKSQNISLGTNRLSQEL
jgi:regulatory protein